MPHLPILVVDENDQPVGKASFDEADDKGLIRRIVRLMLENGKGQVLLQKRIKTEKVYPGRWDNSASGHVDYGETNDQALMREAYEELGVNDFKPKKAGRYYNEVIDRKRKVKKFNHVYKAYYEDTPLNYGKDEVDEVRWFDIREIKKLIKSEPDSFTDGVIDTITRYY